MLVLPAGMGIGDILMHGPALDALAPERIVVEPRMLDLARRFELAPEVEAGDCPHWTAYFGPERRAALVESATVSRATLLASWLGVEWPRVFQRPRAGPGDYIAFFPDAFEPRRSLTQTLTAQLVHCIRCHVVLKQEFTNHAALADYIAGARAVIAVDSGPMHMAAVLGVPLVACFTHVHPDARLTWMGDGPQEVLVPDWPNGQPPGELHPVAWGASIRAEAIIEALERLLEKS